MSWYIGDYAARVYGPIGRRKDGEWSKREIILAAFADPKEAKYYCRVKQAAGVPCHVVYGLVSP